ncbi:hypothetical protein Hanom_Chr11g01034521 [Helianthus anomalus]
MHIFSCNSHTTSNFVKMSSTGKPTFGVTIIKFNYEKDIYQQISASITSDVFSSDLYSF